MYDEQSEKYLHLSPGFAQIHGTTVEDYKAQVQSREDELADVHEGDRERVAEEYRYYLSTHEDCAIEYRLLRADGKTRWIRELGTAH